MSRFIVGAIGVALAALFYMSGAHATARVVDGNNKKTFFSKDGKKISALEANRKAEAGEEVLACQAQDYECNERTGKCNLKNAR